MTSGESGTREDRPTTDLARLRPVVRASWTADTCDPHDLPHWHPGNPARGQCGVTALVVQDLLGGDLVLGEVFVGDTKVGYHYWNRLPDGDEVDLTADQFHPGEVVVGAEVRRRPPGAPRRGRQQYELLRRRVLAALPDDPAPPAGDRPADPVSSSVALGNQPVDDNHPVEGRPSCTSAASSPASSSV
ncbi:hypothetical protein [Micromonospora sp. WMMD980]|uniref:YunG family protein n=1 Tax=Micromonospora sp. WMMD980 TaxID=3016088 RepID=UPI002415BEF2|nr:hypothetical protein [Micromonospora sp. WMMD980]MDG4801019.1 hypothetical protein [Micromonospora sp. WMMD980]